MMKSFLRISLLLSLVANASLLTMLFVDNKGSEKARSSSEKFSQNGSRTLSEMQSSIPDSDAMVSSEIDKLDQQATKAVFEAKGKLIQRQLQMYLQQSSLLIESASELKEIREKDPSNSEILMTQLGSEQSNRAMEILISAYEDNERGRFFDRRLVDAIASYQNPRVARLLNDDMKAANLPLEWRLHVAYQLASKFADEKALGFISNVADTTTDAREKKKAAYYLEKIQRDKEI